MGEHKSQGKYTHKQDIKVNGERGMKITILCHKIYKDMGYWLCETKYNGKCGRCHKFATVILWIDAIIEFCKIKHKPTDSTVWNHKYKIIGNEC